MYIPFPRLFQLKNANENWFLVKMYSGLPLEIRKNIWCRIKCLISFFLEYIIHCIATGDSDALSKIKSWGKNFENNKCYPKL